jgi:hypothetical protein
MKKLISTNGLLDGHFHDPRTDAAIHERIDPRLAYCYKQDNEDDIQVTPTFTYDLADGQVTAIELSYTIDNPDPQRLQYFRDTCQYFFELHGFMIAGGDASPRVYFRATDIFDMASLLHALDYLSVCLEGAICAVDDSLTEKDAIYSPSGSYIIQIPDVPHYSIEEGTLHISPMAARHCTTLQTLDVPAGMLFFNDSLHEYPQDLKVKVWETHYDGTPVEEEEDDEDDDMPVFDEHEVGYSKDGKILTGCRHTFIDACYEVPDGVEVIDDFAFFPCPHFVELSIPRSVRIIGDNIFGNGGQIVMREAPQLSTQKSKVSQLSTLNPQPSTPNSKSKVSQLSTLNTQQ